MKKEQVLKMIDESLATLKESGMVEKDAVLNSKTVLMGKDSPLDSIGFVTFITDLEEKIMKETNKDVYLVIDQINEFNINNPSLPVNSLAEYIVKITEG